MIFALLMWIACGEEAVPEINQKRALRPNDHQSETVEGPISISIDVRPKESSWVI